MCSGEGWIIPVCMFSGCEWFMMLCSDYKSVMVLDVLVG